MTPADRKAAVLRHYPTLEAFFSRHGDQRRAINTGRTTLAATVQLFASLGATVELVPMGHALRRMPLVVGSPRALALRSQWRAQG